MVQQLASVVLAPLRVVQALNELRGRIDLLIDEVSTLNRTARDVDRTGGAIVEGGADLTRATRAQHAATQELIQGGARLPAVSEQIEADLRVFRAALPRLLGSLHTVEELEGAVETVAETLEPLQGAAERVGRVTDRLSRRR